MNHSSTPPPWAPPQTVVRYEPAWQPAPAERAGVFRYVALACVTVIALSGLLLVGLVLVPRSAPVVMTPAASPSTVRYLSPAGSATGAASGYSCGSAAGHSVWIENGTVPCDHARTVAAQWLTTGTTPGDGDGSAGTMYSWSCAADTGGEGYCTSKMGSHLRIGA